GQQACQSPLSVPCCVPVDLVPNDFAYDLGKAFVKRRGWRGWRWDLRGRGLLCLVRLGTDAPVRHTVSAVGREPRTNVRAIDDLMGVAVAATRTQLATLQHVAAIITPAPGELDAVQRDAQM